MSHIIIISNIMIFPQYPLWFALYDPFHMSHCDYDVISKWLIIWVIIFDILIYMIHYTYLYHKFHCDYDVIVTLWFFSYVSMCFFPRILFRVFILNPLSFLRNHYEFTINSLSIPRLHYEFSLNPLSFSQYHYDLTICISTLLWI